MPRRRSPKKSAEAQRRALLEAMARLVAEHGWRGVRTTALARDAHVSKNALYHHFDGKEGCLGALHDEVVDLAVARIEEGSEWGGGTGGRLRAALASLATLIATEPDAARLVLVDVGELGATGVARRRRAAAKFEMIAARALAPDGMCLSTVKARAIVAGIAAVARRSLSEGRAGEPALPVEELSGWAADLAAEEDEAGLRAALATRGRRPGGGADEVPWSESPRSRRSRRELGRRERFVRGAVRLAAGRGAGALSIPVISYAAASSNEAFYDCFADIEEALFAAFDDLAGRALAACREGPPPVPGLAGSLAAALAALRGDLATGFFLPRLAFVELPVLGPRGAFRAQDALDALAAALVAPVPGRGRTAREAQAGALWGLVERALVRDMQA